LGKNNEKMFFFGWREKKLVPYETIFFSSFLPIPKRDRWNNNHTHDYLLIETCIPENLSMAKIFNIKL